MAKQVAPSLNESMKLITGNMINSLRLTDLFFGTVISVSPLKIRIDQQHILEEPSLILSNMVKDHAVDITVSMQTVNDNYLVPTHTHPGDSGGNTGPTADFDTTHKHDITGRKKIIMHYGLKDGEKVILVRMTGGQRYLILDRVETPICEGEYL